MARLGYVYNRAAANLRSANAGLIGLVINDLRNPFFTEFATSVQMALSARGYATVIANTNEDETLQSQVLGAMIEHGVSALIVSPAYGGDSAAFDAIARAGIPAMQVLRKADERVDQFPFAVPDYREGGRIATEHLLGAGARRIAFAGGLPGRPVTQDRMAGYLQALEKAGHASFVIPGRASRAFGRETAIRLASRHPEVDAVLCFNDLVALGMLSGLAQTRSKIRTVGFDGIEEGAETYPSLTSVHCGIETFGERIAATVLDWLENGVVPEPEIRTPVELIIRDFEQRPHSMTRVADPEAFLRALFDKAVEVADPMRSLATHLPPRPAGRVLVIGAGKASARMAEAVEAAWGPCEGLVITRYGYGRPCRGIEIVEAAHPVPDETGHKATLRVLDLVRGLTADDFVLALISGGASALLVAPAEGLTLEDKKAVNAALLDLGAPIDRMNIVRKHLSRVKGGRLAAAVHPARMLALMISDVPGDDPAFIGSGPTVGDATSPDDALEILRRWRVGVPEAVLAALSRPSGVVPPGDPRLARVREPHRGSAETVPGRRCRHRLRGRMRCPHPR